MFDNKISIISKNAEELAKGIGKYYKREAFLDSINDSYFVDIDGIEIQIIQHWQCPSAIKIKDIYVVNLQYVMNQLLVFYLFDKKDIYLTLYNLCIDIVTKSAKNGPSADVYGDINSVENVQELLRAEKGIRPDNIHFDEKCDDPNSDYNKNGWIYQIGYGKIEIK